MNRPPGSAHLNPQGLPAFLGIFGAADQTVQDIADKAQQLQQRIDENAEQEKAGLRTATEQKHQEIERHASELSKHAAQSIESYKASQLETAERQKAYQQAVAKQQADHAKRLIDQQAAQAIAAIEARDRHLELQRQQRDLMSRVAPPMPVGAAAPLANLNGAFAAVPTVAPAAGA